MQINHQSKDPIVPEMPEASALNKVEISGLVMSTVEKNDRIEKKPITTMLRNLSIGESVDFPWEQRASALGIANRLKKEMARIGWGYSYNDDSDNFVVKITRIA